MADAGRSLQILSSAPDSAGQQNSRDAARQLAQRQLWAREMRLRFSPRDMIFENGTLNPDYFKPKQQKVMVRKWGVTERSRLIKGIEKHGIGSWAQIREEFLPAWEIGELRIKTQRLMGRQSLAEYIEAVWKGDETMVEMEYARNKKIGLSLNHWKGGVLVNDENGVVKQRLETEPLEPEYVAYLARRSVSPAVVEPVTVTDPVGQRVSVWFADAKQYFSGLVLSRAPGEHKFHLIWDSQVDDPHAQPDEVDLPPSDKTTSTANNERWCLETELHALTRRPMKAHFGTALELQGPLPLNSPISLEPSRASPKHAKRRGRKSKFSRQFDSESDEEV